LEPFCAECGRPGAVADHIVPIEAGGADLDMSNLQTLCNACHNRKHPEKGGHHG
jgi:5-methylcytosine-specific restriction endonuclease McrA